MAKFVFSGFADEAAKEALKAIFRSPSLKMLSFTITEKGYALKTPAGEYMGVVQADMEEGPEKSRHAMAVVAALLWERYKAGRLPMAVVSMDNCSHNGEKLMSSVLAIAEAWVAKGFVENHPTKALQVILYHGLRL